MPNPINPHHRQQRAALRMIGPAVLAVGLLLIAIGLVSFFGSMGSFEPPRYFWCAFLGAPVMFVGLVLCKFAFMGSVARYAAGEIAPVGADTFNYVAGETQEGVADAAEAILTGARRGSGQAEEDSVEERLRQLDELHEAGLITRDEYQQQRSRILSEL